MVEKGRDSRRERSKKKREKILMWKARMRATEESTNEDYRVKMRKGSERSNNKEMERKKRRGKEP